MLFDPTRASGNAPGLPDDGLLASAALDEARARHRRRQLAQALDHGTALLAALGLPRLVEPGFAPIDREAAGEAIEAAVAVLDAIDAPGEDREDDAPGEEEPDREDDGTAEPSLGAPENHPRAPVFHGGYHVDLTEHQLRWAAGSQGDAEQDVCDEPHDGDGLHDADREPSIGWPEDFTAMLSDALQADHDPEQDDADLEDGDEDEVWRAPWPDGLPPHMVSEAAHV